MDITGGIPMFQFLFVCCQWEGCAAMPKVQQLPRDAAGGRGRALSCTAGLFPPLGQCPGGACRRTLLFFSFPFDAVSMPVCAWHSGFVCSAWNAVVSSERVKLTPSSPARALVTVCIAFCVCLQCQECSGQFREGHAHTIIPSTGIGHCVHCILRLFAVPEMQWSVQQGTSSRHHPQHGHWSLCALRSVFVCSAGNAAVSSERVKLTPWSLAQALVTVCIAFCVCLQCLKCSSQFSKAQAHTVIPEEGIPRTGSSKDFRSMADIGGEDIGNKVTGWLVGQ